MSDAILFDEQVVLVTGAGRGLGRSYARELARRHATVIVHDAGVGLDGSGHDETVAGAVAEEIAREGGRAYARAEDVGERARCDALVDAIVAEHGRLDAVVHSAGIVAYEAIAQTSPETWDRLIAVNVSAPFWISKRALPHMAERGYGRLVFTVSGHGLFVTGARDLTAYSVTKAAQFGLMNALAGEGAAIGVRSNAISPVAATRMYRTPVAPGESSPELVAPAVVFLASSRCDVSGWVVRANRGRFSGAHYAAGADIDLGPAATAEQIAEHWPELSRNLEPLVG